MKNTEKNIKDNIEKEDSDIMPDLRWLLWGGSFLILLWIYFKGREVVGDNVLLVVGVVAVAMYWAYRKLYQSG